MRTARREPVVVGLAGLLLVVHVAANLTSPYGFHRDEYGSADSQAALAQMAAGMREKSNEFLASGGKVYLPEPSVGGPAPS